jgi:hypothetical protein
MRRSCNSTETLRDHSDGENGRQNGGFDVRFEDERGRVAGVFRAGEHVDARYRKSVISALADLIVEDLLSREESR